MAESGCLNDGHLQNVEIQGRLDVTGASPESGMTYRRVVDQRLLNTGGNVSATLTRDQSGTLFLIDGTDANAVTLPTFNTANVGVTYEFLVTTAGSSKTVTFIIGDNDNGSDFWLNNVLTGAQDATKTTLSQGGDNLVLVANTAIGSHVKMTCVNDNGTSGNSTWMADVNASPLATQADA